MNSCRTEGEFNKTVDLINNFKKYFMRYGEKVDEFWLRFHAMHMCFTMEKAYRDLGYKPHLTTEEVIENTILWAYDQCKKK